MTDLDYEKLLKAMEGPKGFEPLEAERLRVRCDMLESENARLYGINLDLRADLSRIPGWV